MFTYNKSLLKRIIVYLLIFVLFLVTDFVVIAWAFGYRWDFQNRQLTKTGAIVIATNQPKYSVLVNKKKINNSKNKLVIKNLLPREYSLKIEKEGFYPWEKNINVEAYKISYYDKIILFPKNNRPETILYDVDDYKLNQEKNIIYASRKNKNQIIQFSILENKIINQIEIADIENFYPSFDGQKILIIPQNQTKKIKIIDIQNKNKTFELPINKENLQKIEWSLKDNNLFLIYENNLYLINLEEEKMNLNLLANSVKDFNLTENYIFYWQKKEESFDYYLWQSNYSFNEKNIIITLPLQENETIFPSPDGEKIIFKNKNEEIYLVLNKKLKKINDKAKIIKWNKNSQKLIYSTDFEINLLEFYENNNYNQKSINRFTENIEYLDWLPLSQSNYLLFAINKKIKISELDGNNTISLTEAEKNLNIISLGENKQKNQIKLFFFRGKGPIFNLFSLEII